VQTPGDDLLDIRIDNKVFCDGNGEQVRVLRGICFSARAGEVLALFGASGTGKTTTLRIVLGLDDAFDGHIRRPTGRVGVMFQEPRLLPWLTLAENLRLVTPADPSSSGIAALLAEVGLPGAANRLPRELSLGMARRAALARALSVDPGLLVLDEPFASLDPLLAATLAEAVARPARDRGATVLIATHDLVQVLPIANRILVFAGRPATLAADTRVPAGAGVDALARLRADLLARFPFMDANTRSETQQERI